MFLWWSHVLVAALVLAGRAPSAAAQQEVATATSAAAGPVDAKIEIVWPHDALGNGAPVESATLVNVEVYLFRRNTLEPVDCGFSQQVSLRWTQNLQARHPFGTSGRLNPTHHALAVYGLTGEGALGERVIRREGDRVFPVWVFNDVPVVPSVVPTARPSLATTYFMAEVQGVEYRTNVWAHSHNPLTFVPGPVEPEAVGVEAPASVDALFQAVWPHDAQGAERPVGQAPLVNVAAELFQHPVRVESSQPASANTSVASGFGRPVRLSRALNSGLLEVVRPNADAVTQVTRPPDGTGSGGLTWPRWHFNDVDVAAARDPANTYYFALQVDGVPTHTTVWAHGASAVTVFPHRDVPTRSGAGCA